MTVLASLFSGISGITSNGSALSVSGDNIANMNTMAFKSGNALFESNLTQKIGDVEVGLGSRLAATNSSFTQGAFGSSSRSTDLAIQGNGFFVVQNTQQERFYTRAGSFSQNADGELVSTVGGLQLLGYQINDGTTGSTLQPINLATINSSPGASDTVSISMNLDPTDSVPAAFDGSSLASAEATSSFSVPAQLYDSRGTARDVVVYFRKTAVENEWDYYAVTALNNLEAGAGYELPGVVDDEDTVIMKAGTIIFSTSGNFVSKNASGASASAWSTTGTNSIIEAGELLSTASQIRWSGAEALDWASFNVDLGDAAGSAAVATQFDTGSDSVATFVSANGQGVGNLQSVAITTSGIVQGIFSNGESRDLFQIPLATFPNSEGLSRVGSNLFESTAASGTALIGQAATTGRGEMRSFAIEQSNVDLATEFVKIIQFQRAFQASARTITAAADILQDLVNLGR